MRIHCLLFSFLVPATGLAAFDPASMWAVGATGAGDNRLPNTGYEVAPVVESHVIHLATLEVGAYHHHPILINHEDIFCAAFSEGRNGEAGPGAAPTATGAARGLRAPRHS